MFISRRLASAVGAVASLAFATASHAALFVSTIPTGTDTTKATTDPSNTTVNTYVNTGGPSASGLFDKSSKAIEFTPTSTKTVGTATILLADPNYGATPNPNKTSAVQLLLFKSAAAGSFLDTTGPGAYGSVGTFAATPDVTIANGSTTPTFSGNFYTFNPTSTFSVTGGTKYTLLVVGYDLAAGSFATAASNRIFQAIQARNTANGGLAAEFSGSSTLGLARFGNGAGGTDPHADLSSGTSSNIPVFSINDTITAVVPEPTTGMLGLVVGGLTLARRRR